MSAAEDAVARLDGYTQEQHEAKIADARVRLAERRGASTITFTVPKSLWLSANQRMHWAPKSKATRELREYGRIKVMSTRGGLGPFGTTHVAAFIGYPRGGRVDPSNAAPTVKALIDGMTDAGVWPDDDSTHVLGPTYLRDKTTGQAGVHTVRFVITPQEVPF